MKTKPKATLYHCDTCIKPIAAIPDDPVCSTRLGTHHYACMLRAFAAERAAEEERQAEVHARRVAHGKRVFGKVSHEETA